MIVKIDKRSPFERIMLEAPARKPYMKVVTASPDSRLKQFADNIDPDPDEEEEVTDMELVDDTDFEGNIETDMMDISDEELAAEDDTDPEGLAEDPPPEDADTGVEMDDTEPTVEAPGDNPEPTVTTPEGDTPPAEGGLQTDPPEGTDATPDADPDAAGGEGEAPAEGEGGDLQTDAPEGGDFEDNIEDTGDESMETDDATDGTADDAEATRVKNNLENQLRYSLYRNLKHLLEAIVNYQERLDAISSPNINYNMVLKSASDKLAEIEECIHEYMALKYRDEEYLTSMHFYQKCLVAVRGIFEMIKDNQKNDNLKDGTLN